MSNHQKNKIKREVHAMFPEYSIKQIGYTCKMRYIKAGRGQSQKCKILGKEYPSLRQASIQLKMNRHEVINHPSFEFIYESTDGK